MFFIAVGLSQRQLKQTGTIGFSQIRFLNTFTLSEGCLVTNNPRKYKLLEDDRFCIIFTKKQIRT